MATWHVFRSALRFVILLGAVAPCLQFQHLASVRASIRPSRSCLSSLRAAADGDDAVLATQEIIVAGHKNQEIETSAISPAATPEQLDPAPFATWFSKNAARANQHVGLEKLRVGEAWGDTATPEPSWNGFCGRGRRRRPPWWPKRKRMASWRTTPRSTHVWGEISVGTLPEAPEVSSFVNGRADEALGMGRGESLHSAHAWRSAPCNGEVRLVSFDTMYNEMEVVSLPLYGNRKVFDLSSLKEQWGEEDAQ